MGTALLERGLSGPPPAWNLTHPEEVARVHRSHVAAGAGMVLTNTFAGASAGQARAAIRLARESGARFVGGSLWAGLPDLAVLIAHLEGVDCLWLESAVDAEQAHQALAAALSATALPIVVTCAMRVGPLQSLRARGAAAVGYNCSPWPEDAAGADVVKPDAAGLDEATWARAVAPARLRGGCCGTNAAYLGALRATVR